MKGTKWQILAIHKLEFSTKWIITAILTGYIFLSTLCTKHIKTITNNHNCIWYIFSILFLFKETKLKRCIKHQQRKSLSKVCKKFKFNNKQMAPQVYHWITHLHTCANAQHTFKTLWYMAHRISKLQNMHFWLSYWPI